MGQALNCYKPILTSFLKSVSVDFFQTNLKDRDIYFIYVTLSAKNSSTAGFNGALDPNTDGLSANQIGFLVLPRLLLFGDAHASSRSPNLSLFHRKYSVPLHILQLNTPFTESPSYRPTNVFVINLQQVVASLQCNFKEALKINALLSRAFIHLYSKKVLLSGGTSSIVHYREYPSGKRDLVMKFQFLDVSWSGKFQN